MVISRWLLGFALLANGVLVSASFALDEVFPEQLDLSTALRMSKALSPSYLRTQTLLSRAEDQQALVAQRKNWQAQLALEGRSASRANGQSNSFAGDSRAELHLSKLLWDFGQSQPEKLAAQQGTEAAEMAIATNARLQRIEVMRRFFDVLLADYAYTVKDETMTLSYLAYSRADDKKQRYDSVSELEVLEKHSDYLRKLVIRNKARQRQRRSRLELGLAMGWPDAKPNQLIEPSLLPLKRPFPAFDQLVAMVSDSHPKLAQLNKQMQSEQSLGQSVSNASKPTLNLDLYAAEFERNYTSKDQARAALRLEWPLLPKQSASEREIVVNDKIAELKAQILELQYQIRREVLSWVQRLESLQQREQHSDVEIEYRERALDKSRLLYELEVRTEIGKAQTQMAAALYEQAKIKFERALVWEQIDLALNRPLREEF